MIFFFFSSRRRHTRCGRDWSSDVCSSDLDNAPFHSGKYAYVSGMGNGALSIVDADSRQLLKTLNFAPALCHQGRVSPDGTIMLVSVLPTRKLHKLAVDESNGSWTPLSSVEFPVGKAPVCSVFRADSQRAYVSAMMDGIVIVDVPSMTILGTLPTDGL